MTNNPSADDTDKKQSDKELFKKVHEDALKLEEPLTKARKISDAGTNEAREKSE